MNKKGKELEFVSLILRDGSGVVPVGTPWNSDSEHAKTDSTSYLDDVEFTLRTLSLKEKTYIAFKMNAWVVKLKNK